MLCDFDRNLLQDYLDRETGPLENLIIEEHLRSCPECQVELEHLMMLFWSLENQSETALPEELTQLREETINLWLDEKIGQSLDYSHGLKTAGANPSSFLSATWHGQSVWIDQALSIVKYLPVANAAALGTSTVVKKSGRLAGRVLFNLAKRSVLAAAAYGRT
jgi:anti-sigma factor RsiW